MLLVAVGLSLLASTLTALLIEPLRDQDQLINLAVALLGVAAYAAVLYLAGKAHRFMQTISSALACGAILTLLAVAAFVLIDPFLGRQMAFSIAWLIIVWSVPVDGHIIARAIQQHWYVGISIALAVFILQIGFQSALTTKP